MTLFDLRSADLFGNEAAEDEDERIFISHLLVRDDLQDFYSPSNPIRIIMAYKGEGKSSLLRSLATDLSRQERAIVVRTTGAAVFPEVTGYDPAKWARAWKKELYKLIAVSVGTAIGHAWKDDAISLLEEAEKEGFRQRNVVSAIVDRIVPKLSAGGVELSRSRLGGNFEQILKRYRSGEVEQIWLVVDDIDRNFRDTKTDKARIVGFFDAIRDMRNAVPQLRVRTSIRPNVLASVRLDFESISHVRQYVMKMSWSESQVRQMLARRIEGYLTRTAKIAGLTIPPSGEKRDLFYISMLFESPVRWGEKNRSIHIPLYTLSAHRPRWLVELCKVSSLRAADRRSAKISLDDVRDEMEEFGANRRADLVAEFRPQCPQLEDMFDAFRGKKDLFSTTELYELIENQILSKFSPNIAGLSGRARAADVASFLFEVGLFFGRREKEKGGYEHVSYSQRPNMFKSALGPDQGLQWEIHPVFRAVLDINKFA